MLTSAASRIEPVPLAGTAVRQVIAIVAGTIALRLEELPARVLEGLRHDLSFPNPEYVARKRICRYLGATPERFECLVEAPDGWVHVPRGAVTRLRERLAEAGHALHVHDRRVAAAVAHAMIPRRVGAGEVSGDAGAGGGGVNSRAKCRRSRMEDRATVRKHALPSIQRPRRAEGSSQCAAADGSVGRATARVPSTIGPAVGVYNVRWPPFEAHRYETTIRRACQVGRAPLCSEHLGLEAQEHAIVVGLRAVAAQRLRLGAADPVTVAADSWSTVARIERGWRSVGGRVTYWAGVEHGGAGVAAGVHACRRARVSARVGGRAGRSAA